MGQPVVAFDPSGLVFAVALGGILRLYDVKSFDQGPFVTAMIGDSLGITHTSIYATQIEFSSDGKLLLITTGSDAHYIVDAYTPSNTMFKLVGHNTNTFGNEPFTSGSEACWTPDGKCVMSGSRDGDIYVWDISKAIADQAAGIVNGSASGGANNSANGGGSSGNLLQSNGELRPFKTLKAHGTPSHIVAFNPKYLMMVSGSTELVRFDLFFFFLHVDDVQPGEIINASINQYPYERWLK
jgi:COMPASS component SWD2